MYILQSNCVIDSRSAFHIFNFWKPSLSGSSHSFKFTGFVYLFLNFYWHGFSQREYAKKQSVNAEVNQFTQEEKEKKKALFPWLLIEAKREV